MDLFDNEKEIISFSQSVQTEEVALIPSGDQQAEKLFLSITKEALWNKWTDSSAHDAPPPDFYNEETFTMMDIMRVDDHGYKNKKGKTVNPARRHDTELMHELENSGILNRFPNAKPLVIGHTDLSTYEDHNYEYYYKNFCQTVNSHKKKIANYKKNHPGFSVVFFIFDESSMYCSTLEPYQHRKVGDLMKGIPHLWFTDKRFAEVLINSEIDYLIWFTPYKYVTAFDENGERVTLPRAVVISIQYLDKIPFNDYLVDTMESTEL